jgi:gliding motility-associated-like protein
LNADITTTGGATYAWNGPNGFISNIQSPFIVNATPANNGIYYVAVTVDGCTATDSVTVTVSEHSVGGFTGPDATACRGNNSGLIHLSGNFGEITRWEVSINNGLTWAPVNNNGFFMSYNDLTTTTWYRAVVQSGACPPMNSTITKISVINSVQSVSITPDSVGTCIHDTTILFTANPVYTGTDPVSYYWYVNGQIQGTTNPFTWHIQVPVGDLSTHETTIKVLAENSLGCGDTSLAAKAIIYPFPVITKTKSNDISCYWGTSNLVVTGADHYFWWSSDSSISDPHASSITIAPKESSTYHFRAISANGCIKEDSIRVLVDKNISHGQFNVPNAFTPNGDGLNDQFCVSGFTSENFELLIYDRPGKLLFRTADPSKCWDGTFNGKQQPLGVYVYWLRAKTACDEGAFHKGYIVLIR